MDSTSKRIRPKQSSLAVNTSKDLSSISTVEQQNRRDLEEIVSKVKLPILTVSVTSSDGCFDNFRVKVCCTSDLNNFGMTIIIHSTFRVGSMNTSVLAFMAWPPSSPDEETLPGATNENSESVANYETKRMNRSTCRTRPDLVKTKEQERQMLESMRR